MAITLAKKTFTVDIGEDNSNYVERLWYEYNAKRDIIKFLMSDSTVLDEVLQRYTDVCEEKFVELEMAKQKVANTYKPEEVDLTKYNYAFDFDNHSITFTEA